MKSNPNKKGFTLVEILVAVAIIVTIVSMVYGSYFAASKSTEVCKAKIALSQEGRKVLERMARQIRCSYVDTISDSMYTTKPVSERKEKRTQNNLVFFSGYADNPSEEILHLITTNKFGTPQNSPEGLFDVTYRFDKSEGLLYLSQERFVGTAKNSIEKRSWQPIAENVESLKLGFFDGQQWLDNWSFKDRKRLPNAVKIDITFEDQTHRTYRYGTVAYVCCHENHGRESQSGELVIAKNK